MTKTIDQHEGKKYLRKIQDAKDSSKVAEIDVYAVLVAFNVTCPGRQQAIKKIAVCWIAWKGR